MGQSLFEQRGVPLDQVPHTYGEYFDFLKNKLGVKFYGNQTMMPLCKIDPVQVTPIPLEKMVRLFEVADRTIVY